MSNDTVNKKNSAYNSTTGRYAVGGKTEVSSFALEWWDKAKMERSPTDIVYAMEKKYEDQPDLLGYVFYGDERLWWVICQYNGIIDPWEELVEGKILYIPTLSRVKKLLRSTGGVGGIPSTRIK